MYTKYEVDGANSFGESVRKPRQGRKDGRTEGHTKNGTKAKTECPSGVPPGGAQLTVLFQYTI